MKAGCACTAVGSDRSGDGDAVEGHRIACLRDSLGQAGVVVEVADGFESRGVGWLRCCHDRRVVVAVVEDLADGSGDGGPSLVAESIGWTVQLIDEDNGAHLSRTLYQGVDGIRDRFPLSTRLFPLPVCHQSLVLIISRFTTPITIML